MAKSREQKRIERKQSKAKVRAAQYAAAAARKKQKGIEVKNRPIKENGYHSAKSQLRRNKKRDQAEKRQFIYEHLDLKDKINLIKSRRGESKRELAKLENVE